MRSICCICARYGQYRRHGRAPTTERHALDVVHLCGVAVFASMAGRAPCAWCTYLCALWCVFVSMASAYK